MKWASAVARSPNASEAVARACKDVQKTMGEGPVDLVLFFVTPHFREAFGHLHGWIQACLPATTVAGCTGGGVIGGGVEVEAFPAFAVIAARLPEVSIDVIHTEGLDLPDADAAPSVWRSWLGLQDGAPRHFLILADPFSTQLDALLTGLDYAFPHTAKVGGVASGGRNAGEQALFSGPRVFQSGALLIALGGEIAVETLVAQGCRSIGRALTVTRCENNVLMEIDGRPPLRYLAELVEESTPADKELMRRSLLLGVQADEPVDARADGFLIRNLVGIDYKRGILAASTALRPGQLVQFHLRDKASASDELRRMLAQYRLTGPNPPCGALLFSCLGRGQHLYEEAGHDSRLCREIVGDLPLAGFFCNGEIGPVAGATHIHGYTSAFAFFRPPERRTRLSP
jgi:small ligand-binding sensory domain FIST